MRGRNSFDRAPVRLTVGAEKDAGQDRRQPPGHALGINSTEMNRGQMANFNPGQREQPRRKEGVNNAPNMAFIGRPNDMFGIIVSIKEILGVIQLLRSEEQILFSVRDGSRDIAIGDEVSFVVKQTSKGLQAEGLQLISPELKRSATGVLGTVVSPPDSARGRPGLIEVSSQIDGFFGFQVGQVVPFMGEDYRGMHTPTLANGGPANQPQSRIAKGDQLHCTVSIIPDTTYCRATHVRTVRTKKDCFLFEQASHLQSIGGVRERGVLDSFLNAECGFIKPVDRPEQIYFRIEDFRDSEIAQIREGTEVDFYVIHQTLKGKLCDRAVNLQILPPGSVQFEITIAEDVEAVVGLEAKVSGKDEEPGLLRLINPVKREGKPDLTDIELWPRCVPEGMIFKVGDRLRLDVQNYRPERILFARAVRLKSYRKIGRETGVVCGVRDQGFGFVRSDIRDFNIFFRLSEVIGEGGVPAKEGCITVGSCLSFDVAEETRGVPNTKLRAVRVQLLPPDTVSVPSYLSMPAVDGLTLEQDHQLGGRVSPEERSGGLTLMQAGVKGVIVTVAKRDSPGVLKASNPLDLGGDSQQSNSELFEAIAEFRDCPEIEEVVLEHVPSTMRKEYQDILMDKFTGIGYECRGRSLRLFKMASGPYQAWRRIADVEVASRAAESESNGLRKSAEKEDESKVVKFKLEDTHDEFGPMAKDLKVIFSLYVDKKTNKKIAKNVRLTDEPVPGMTGDQTGILDVVVLRTGRFGFIRCLSSDEKLFWHSSGSAASTNQNDLQEGREVAFQMRRRGGLRCAVNIRVLPQNSLFQEVDLPGKCTGVVVDNGQIVLLDVSNCPSLLRKYWDITKIPEILQQIEKTRNMKKKSASTWGKKNTELDEKVPLGTNERQSDLGGWVNEDSVTSNSSTGGVNGGLEELNDEAELDLQEEAEDTYGAKYLPPLVRQPLPIGPSVTAIGVRTYRNMQVGDLVQCRVVANWVLQRSPLRVSDVELLSWSALSTVPGTGDPSTETRPDVIRMQGQVSRPKVRVRGGGADGAGYELCEIKEVKTVSLGEDSSLPAESTPSGAIFFCDFREPKLAGDALQQWDDVEFIGIRDLCVAVAVTVTSKKPKEIASKRAPLNVLIKNSSNPFQGFKAIKMAEGPPDDGLTVGFATGWRGDEVSRAAPDIMTLSWKHLLQHLLPHGSTPPSGLSVSPSPSSPFEPGRSPSATPFIPSGFKS